MKFINILVIVASLSLLVNADDILLGEENIAAFIPIDNENKMFYWLFPARNKDSEAPLVVWLQGGPGCSGKQFSSLNNFFRGVKRI